MGEFTCKRFLAMSNTCFDIGLDLGLDLGMQLGMDQLMSQLQTQLLKIRVVYLAREIKLNDIQLDTWQTLKMDITYSFRPSGVVSFSRATYLLVFGKL